MVLNKDGTVADDRWVHLDDDAPIPSDIPFTVSKARYLGERTLLAPLGERVGIRVVTHDEPEELAPFVGTLSLVVVNFPKAGDGRGYSLARLLRDRYGYRGELRATGDVLPDNLFYMARCGFDAFELKPGKSLEHARAALAPFSVTYQGAADDPRPLYRRVERRSPVAS